MLITILSFIAYYIASAYLDELRSYYQIQDILTVSNLVLLFPISAIVAVVFLALAWIRALQSENQLPRLFTRYRVALWLEFPMAFILLLYSAPAIYALVDIFSRPCAVTNVCRGYWTADVVEAVILFQLLFLAGGILAVDVLRIAHNQDSQGPSRQSSSDDKQFPERIELDPRFSQVEARLFFAWYYFLPFSSLLGWVRDLDHIPRDKLVLVKKTRIAYWVGDYAMGLLVPVQKVEWVAERKPISGFNLKQWAEKRNWTPKEETATEVDLT